MSVVLFALHDLLGLDLMHALWEPFLHAGMEPCMCMGMRPCHHHASDSDGEAVVPR